MGSINEDSVFLENQVILEELMLWREPDIKNITICHAIAYNRSGIQLMDAFKNCEKSEIIDSMLSNLIQAVDTMGNSCLHLACLQNYIEFLKTIFGEKHRKYLANKVINLFLFFTLLDSIEIISYNIAHFNRKLLRAFRKWLLKTLLWVF